MRATRRPGGAAAVPLRCFLTSHWRVAMRDSSDEPRRTLGARQTRTPEAESKHADSRDDRPQGGLRRLGVELAASAGRPETSPTPGQEWEVTPKTIEAFLSGQRAGAIPPSTEQTIAGSGHPPMRPAEGAGVGGLEAGQESAGPRTNGIAVPADRSRPGSTGEPEATGLNEPANAIVIQGVVQSRAADATTGTGSPGVVVRAFDYEVGGGRQIGEATTDAAGHYRITIPAGASSQDPAVFVEVVDGDDRVIEKSRVVFQPELLTTINLEVQQPAGAESEFERLNQILKPRLNGRALRQVTSDQAAVLGRDARTPSRASRRRHRLISDHARHERAIHACRHGDRRPCRATRCYGLRAAA